MTLNNSIIFQTAKLMTWDLLRDIFKFPIWWYTNGLEMIWQRTFGSVMRWQYRLGLGIWLKNWFKPMYAQYDWQGRLLSLFFRTLTITYKSIIFLLGFVLIMFGFLVYLLLPFVAVLLLFASFIL